METVLSVAALAAITLLSVVGHLRRSRASAASCSPPTPRSVAPCPRCSTPVPETAAACPGCGVPLQLYEVVMARTVAADATAPGGGGRLHAVVRTDLCVGCGTCAAACPEPGALRVEHKVAIVDLGSCVGHGSCERACPVGAIAVTSGEAVQRVRVPDLTPEFETNVPGLYVVGELGGRGLIKNAINEGKIAVENVARAISGRPRPAGEVFDLVVVGGGPAGLSAGLEAHRLGLRYVVLEQGSLADTIRKYPRKKLLLAEPIKVPLYGDLWVGDAAKETLLQVWDTIIRTTGLNFREQHKVESIVRMEGLLHVTAAGRAVRARCVVLALGRRGSPRRLGVPGEELDKVLYDIVEMDAFRGRRVVVVGGGDSAIESALGLANQQGTEVVLSYRGENLNRAKPRNLEKLEARVREGRIRLALKSRVREIRAQAVVLESDGRNAILPNDDVIVRIGGDPPYEFLEKIGVRIVQKDVPLPDAKTAVRA